MFTSNPWTAYAVALTGSMLIYYSFIGWKYYRTEIRSLFRGETKISDATPGSKTDQPQASVYKGPGPDPSDGAEQAALENEALFTKVEALDEHLITQIEEAHQKGYNKQDLIQMLQMILKGYGTLKGTLYEYAVHKRIDAECAKYGLIHLSEDDKDQLWSIA